MEVGSQNHTPAPVHIIQEAGWAPGPICRVQEILLTPVFEPRAIQPVPIPLSQLPMYIEF
jgi:hypothetical protein